MSALGPGLGFLPPPSGPILLIEFPPLQPRKGLTGPLGGLWGFSLVLCLLAALLSSINDNVNHVPVRTTVPFSSTTSPTSSVTSSTSFVTSPVTSSTSFSTMSDTSATQITTPSTLSTSTPATILTSTTTLESTATSTTSSSTNAPTCGSAPNVTGLVAVPSGGANVNDTKVYRCESPDETFPRNAFNPNECPVITCLPDGTYDPSFSSKAMTCQAPQSSPPGDDTQTSPGTITSPGFDGISPYNATNAEYRWNILTTGSQLTFNLTTFEVINGNNQCNDGDRLEIFCGFKDSSREFKLCSGSPAANSINCSVGCAGIVFVVDEKTTLKGIGFSLTWSN
ncbi:hypothetical protein CHS0354_019636 [Potamilus streckersoni]|uniref:CUB domain-containing protein n=1 Tax=Potamilus streckersoni TaxID=2493646 RepID=A0AAE0T9R4_9BIVA|nr:hypothetical protein CHS0354_019636 [Potamilus streckersoni]